MALETASYVANLISTNPDGADARNTADDHLRLIKAALVRTFPKLDGAVSLSATQVMYVNDLSASVQLQLNQLRDGSATANNAINSKYANSASTAALIGTIPAARVLDLGATSTQNAFTSATEVFKLVQNAFYSWYSGATHIGSMQVTSSALILDALGGRSIQLRIGGSAKVTVNTDGTVEFTEVIDGTITNAQTSTTAAQASHAASASFATIASTCTSASSAALLAGIPPSTSDTGSTVALRNAAGYIFAAYLNQSSALESPAVGSVFVQNTGADGYLRKISLANFGAQMDARNISTKTGITKTLASGSGPPSLVGSTNGDIWYYY